MRGLPSDIAPQYNDKGANGPQSAEAITNQLQSVPAETWIVLGVIALLMMIGFIVIGTFLSGMFDYTAAKLADNKTVTFGEAFKAVASRFFSYLWLHILMGLKILLWSLLLIVPGIIMATRYSLSGTSFFRHNLSANAAIKHSASITKGAWLTTFGAFGLFNIISLGLVQPLLQPGTSALLQRQFDDYDAAKLTKPSAHGLSWLVLGLVVTFFALAVALAVVGVLLFTHGFSEGQTPTF
jgi:hypothetical protein